MIPEMALRWARSLAQQKLGRVLIRLAVDLPGGQHLYCAVAARLAPMERRIFVERSLVVLTQGQRRRMAGRLARLMQKPRSIGVLETCWLAIAHAAAATTEASNLSASAPGQLVAEVHANTNFLFARAIAAYETSRFRDAVAAFCAIRDLARQELVQRFQYLKAAYAAGQVRDRALAAEFFARQFFFSGFTFDAVARRDFEEKLIQGTLATASAELQGHSCRGKSTRIGVFFLSSTEALGHAILDPYYFLVLHAKRFDVIMFIGPPRAAYRPASRVCLDIVERYGRYIETTNDVMLNLSWMNLGGVSQPPLEFTLEQFGEGVSAVGRWYKSEKIELGSLDLVIENYWSLLRDAVHRACDVNDAFEHNAWHMKLPESYGLIGEAFCFRHKIDIDKPLVVLHARADNYHGLEKQAFRNADIETYEPGVLELLDRGYQVLRIGDRGMPRLPIRHKNYRELPRLPGYRHELDPYFISKAAFMIGCQSGPCAYARALGTPLLSVNAVLHYTLLPAKMEMACFKRYKLIESSKLRPLDLEGALAAGVHHFDTTIQFERARVRLEPARPEEIKAAVKDMIAWLENPDLPETEHQLRFKAAVEHTAQELARKGRELDNPIADFIGISLPGYRISPTVAAMREAKSVDRGHGPASGKVEHGIQSGQ
ncbi:MAG: TIGR04372 family glycosyltransferase [Pseudolabrys sp.]|nr:TIGR04372 family glycosyltransferase [Pseudolabrys sp.]MDP2295745.1 TIGR04372 family glycosyltransferase [Pseudolabrys sp.]